MFNINSHFPYTCKKPVAKGGESKVALSGFISGLPKAEGLWPKSKVPHLWLRLWLPKVYATKGQRSGRRLEFVEIQ